MDENIFDKINNTLSLIESLSVPKKYKGEILHATEFNSVVDKINEVQEYLNEKNKAVILDTTAYVLDKIENAKISLIASNVKMSENSSRSILDEINDIQYHLNNAENKATDNAADIVDINSRINSIAETMGFISNEIQTTYESAKSYADEVSETAYTRAVESSKNYTDESYTTLYTHINDTTLTFDYDIKTEPEPASPKMIYDNEDDLYDGSYHS